MTLGEFNSFIDELIRQNRCFAFYRLPGEDKIYFVGQEEKEAYTFRNIQSLNGRSGFVIAPFRITDDSPLVLIKGHKEVFNLEETAGATYDYTDKTVPDAIDPAYRQRYQTFTGSLKRNELDKLVLSRKVELGRPDRFSPAMAFAKAVQRYIRSYVYLYHTPRSGTWLGSTPEIILSGRNKDWHTVALAGTLPLVGGALPTNWNDKNRREQQLVAGYIRSQLARLGIEPSEDGPYAVRAAELAHLRSDFRFHLPDNQHLGELLNLLHPTPAVCGLPKEAAYQFILDNEGYDRRYYSGFIGMLDTESDSSVYVNLRCMEIQKKKLYLYAGGGLLSSSTLEEEWLETEDKLFTMKAIIG